MLNYQLINLTDVQNNLPIILLHGLFGSLDNLHILAQDLKQSHPIIQVDLRNHGYSPHSDDMNYHNMAHDIINLMNTLNFNKAILIGHSMGGKVAMYTHFLAASRIEKMIILDMAPVSYQQNQHENIFNALYAVQQAKITSRQQAQKTMKHWIANTAISQFLLKSFDKQNGWRFNLSALYQHYQELMDWKILPTSSIPILFLQAEHSSYITKASYPLIKQQYPLAKIHIIHNTTHWLHAEQPEQVLRAIHRFVD